ncbi:MAG: ribose transporter, permease protein [Caballeronia sp.]|jgi:ribose transport system permease protein|uniref:ABC transporter permease n=1 Tax=Caballeronia sp. TaxID=1931223 RepID=UPI00263A3D3F|nr:ABC transporter permease [Caballeronia sp.]MDB5834258.1 ribose transporter, permease protein [Caballeronia sp.]
MNRIKQLGPYLPWLALGVTILAIGAYDHRFLDPATLIGLIADSATLFLMAIGMTYVVYIGSIDLSMQAVAAVSSIVLALLIPRYGFAGIGVALAAGAAFGLLSGFVHGRLRIPSFIATLAVGGIVVTVARYISGDRSIEIVGEVRDNVLGWAIGKTAGLPDEIWVSLVVLLIALTLEQATPFGKAMKAVGCSEPAARVSGIKVTQIKLMVFTLSGLFAALSGVVLAGRLSSGSPTIANEFLLPAIAAVVLGGTALTGGSGGVMRTLVGTMLIAVVRTGMTFVGVDAMAQQIVFGLILILAVGLSAGRAPKGVVK